jgi:hypothetical protein
MSRYCINKNPGIIKNIRDKFKISGNNMITFKTHKAYGGGPLHFGNTEGSNMFEGQDIAVVGTPHYPEFLYKLFAFSIGLEFDPKETMRRDYKASRNSYNFYFHTYNDDKLRDIHFWALESELEQAVGRARLLRNDCNVYLFSNFPLKQAIMKDDKY